MKTSSQADELPSILVLRAAQTRYESQVAADRELLGQVLAKAQKEPVLAELLARGTEIFGSADSLLRWLLRPHVMFGRSPLATLADGDHQAVEDELCRVEYGEFT